MKEVVLRGGPPVHPTIYSKRILSTGRDVTSGDIVRVMTREGVPCGFGFSHTRSMIALRMLSFDPDCYPDEAWFRKRVRAADHLRRHVLRLPEVTNAWRVAHAEADGLPGLMIDRYRGILVAQIHSLGWHRRQKELESILRDEADAQEVVIRIDPKAAQLEDMDAPRPPRMRPVLVHEHSVRYLVDPTAGHKTGFFLDQRDNRHLVARLARGRRVFDGMTYTGAFALAAMRGGAARVVAMDLDEEAVARAEENAQKNDLKIRFRHGDVFDQLRRFSEQDPTERPELLVLDPPKWARDRKGLGVALARYGDLNRLAMAAVAPGGLVFSHSCSGLVDEPTFLGVIRNAALDTRREVRFLHVGGAAADHPVAAHVPEGRYLKSVLYSVGPEGSGPGRSDVREFEHGGHGGQDDSRPHDRGGERRSYGDDRRPDRRPYPRDDRAPDRRPYPRDDQQPDRRPYPRDDQRQDRPDPRRSYGEPPPRRDDRGPRGGDGRGPDRRPN